MPADNLRVAVEELERAAFCNDPTLRDRCMLCIEQHSRNLRLQTLYQQSQAEVEIGIGVRTPDLIDQID